MHNIQSLVVIAGGTGCLVHRSGSVHPVVNDRLLDMHQTVVPIDLNRNTRKTQRLQTGALIRVFQFLPVRDHAHIHTALVRRHQGFDDGRIGQSIDSEVNGLLGSVIEGDQAVGWTVLR